MKKNIDIPDEILPDLKILAVKANKDLKNYIQDILISLVKSVCDCTIPISGTSIYKCGRCGKDIKVR